LPGGIGRPPPTSGRPRSRYRVAETGPDQALVGKYGDEWLPGQLPDL